MTIYSSCGRPKLCCVAIQHDEENDSYIIYDEEKGWETKEIFYEELIRLRNLINDIEKKRKN